MTEFRTGSEVLIPGKIVGEVGPEKAVVETTSGSRFATRLVDLAVPRSDQPIEERVERLARVMAQGDGVDPDEMAVLYPSLARAQGFVLRHDVFPAWRLYAKYARAIVDKGLA